MKTTRFVIVAIVLICAFTALIYLGVYRYKKNSCENRGGQWATGLAWEYSLSDLTCNEAASDVGKICIDGSECQGECIPDLSDEEIDSLFDPLKQVEFNRSGTCSALQRVTGCGPVVENGFVRGIICSD